MDTVSQLASLDFSTPVQSKNMASESGISRALNLSHSPLAQRSLPFNDTNVSPSYDLAHEFESIPSHALDMSPLTSNYSPCPDTTDATLPTIDSFELPPFRPLNPNSEFTWGSADGATFMDQVDNAYDTVVNWRRNIFRLPYGNIGKRICVRIVLFVSLLC